MKTNILLDMTINNYNLLSVNKAYKFYDIKRKNKYQPYTTSKKEKENIRRQISSQYHDKPLTVTYLKLDIKASGSSDIDNKGKITIDACEGILLKNDRDITTLIMRRASFNKITCKCNKEKSISISLLPNALDNSVNNHWKSKNIKLSKKAIIFKKDIKTLAQFYKMKKKYISEKDIIIVLNAYIRNQQDIDNVFKLLFDSFTKTIYKDDKQIFYIIAHKYIKNKGNNAFRIKIYEKEGE